MTFTRNSKTVLLLACAIWLGAVGYGLRYVWVYENSSGQSGTPPAQWPTASAIQRKPGLPTLIVFIHPHCPCSRATLGELAILMASSQGLVDAHAVFVKPTDAEGWEKTDLWSSASAIPGVNVSADQNGFETTRFGSATSGQATLYSSDGELIFSGGITGSRGHAGDNDGRSALQSLLAGDKAAKSETPVFGCPLANPASTQQPEKSCDALQRN